VSTPEASMSAAYTASASLDDRLRSIRNAFKLGASLVATWTVALVIRLVLPRFLGPELFGTFQFADGFTATVLGLTSFGIEVYVQKEVAVRPQHAADFWGGLLACRTILSLLLITGMAIFMIQAGRPAMVVQLVVVMGAVQALIIMNNGYAALLHAVGSVDGLSVLNVVSKVLWGGGILAGFALGGGLRTVAAAALVAELVRTAGLVLLTRRHLDLRPRIDVSATRAVLWAATPFYVLAVARAVYCRVDVSLISFLTGDIEVGWYGAASNIAALALLITPLLGWVLLPMSSRAHARSEEELNRLLRRSVELVVAVVAPVSLLISLGADVVVATAFGDGFGPAVLSLRIVAPMFVLTYVAMIGSSALVRLGRDWTVTVISLCGMVFNLALNWMLIPTAARAIGQGGAGAAAAFSLLSTELLIVIVTMGMLGRRVIEARTGSALARTALVCAAVCVFHLVCGLHGWTRVFADAAVYGLLGLATGALHAREVWQAVGLAWQQRAAKA
jgi:O-antigen/teichoic acid export membrane protein